LFYAIFFLNIGLKATIKNEPSIINSKWIYAMIVFSLIPTVIINAKDLYRFGSDGTSGLIFSIMPILLLILMVFYYFIMKGYTIYCISDSDFRNSIIFSLNKNLIKFEEKLNKIELIELKNELNISFTAWIGAGMIKLKNKKDDNVFSSIIDDIKQFFYENTIETKKTIAIFYIIFGIIFLIVSIALTIFIIKNRYYFW
jgi:hypothetical protein